MSKKWWQTFAALALGVNALVLLSLLYFGLAYGSNLRKLNQMGDFCFRRLSDYDSIRAAQMIGRLDFVSLLLTAGGLLLALFAFMGFWMIRREALDEAAKVAADEARNVAQEYYKAQVSGPARDDDKGGAESYIDKTVPLDVKDVSITGAVEESGETKKK